MNLDLFSEQITAMQTRMAALRESATEPTHASDERLEETFEVFNVTLEELRVAEEELAEQNQELLLSQQLLEAERQRYRDLFDFAPDGYLVTDKLGMIREANRAAAALLGVGQQYLSGKPLALYVPERDRSEFRAILNSLSLGTEPRYWEGRLVPHHGEPFEAALAVSKVLNLKGEPVGLRWMIRSIAAQKRTEDQLRAVFDKYEQRMVHRTALLESELQSKEQLLANERAARRDADAALRRAHDLLHAVAAIVYETDAATGQFTFVSEFATTLLGYPAADWLLDPNFWINVVHPDDREMVASQRAKHRTAPGDFELDYRVLKSDGHIVWVRDSIRVVADEAGRPRRFRGLITSIHKRKRAERSLFYQKHEIEAQLLDMSYLHELSLRLTSSLDLADVLAEVLKATTALQGTEMGVIWQLDRDRGELTPVSSLGLPAEYLERVGRLPVGAGTCGIAVAERRRVIVEDLEQDPIDAPYVDLARSAGYRAVSTTPLFTREGEILGTLATYFAEPHRPKERQIHLVERYARLAGQFIEHARLHHRLREKAQGKDEFLALIGHELRDPVSAIAGALQLLRVPDTDEAILEEARRVLERQTRHMTWLLDDLLDLTRIDRGQLELHRELIDSPCVVPRTLEAIQPIIDGLGHRVTVHVPSEPLEICADPERLAQILTNLLISTAQSSEPGRRLGLALERDEDDVLFRVRDDGIGIAPEMLPKVFDLSEPGALPSQLGGGLGIALTLVTKLVRLHGGSVSALHSEPGHGSEFVVRLPLARVDREARPGGGDLSPTPRTPAPPSERKALVVDDDPDSARLLGRLLQIWGYDVRFAQSGPEAVAAAHERHPDVVLLDIGLPGMSGCDVAQLLRKEFPAPMHILAITGYSHPGDLRQAEFGGFDEYLVKPIDLDILQGCLARFETSATH